jgi:hypothetical protein
MRATQLGPTDGGLDSLRCPSCRRLLELTQPVPECPVRLLGTCPGCESWCVIDVTPDGTEAIMVLLPTGDALRDAIAAAQSGR